ncbi:wall-associated receptor kinase-like 6 [Chenopodium quinoa]|uniref:Uncharacterized protein n=1 Tax=Chenopodium quinoa TaxID=63459 RepID=A0A803MHE5_CHEQI|nr:wall-associated receptor kinase-like 6 [Chenopodium quinoa]
MIKMFEVRGLYLLLPLLWSSVTKTTFATKIAKPGCQPSCGNVTIYYPFGIGSACSLRESFIIDCNRSSSNDPPKPFLVGSNIEVLNISITGQMLIKSFVTTKLYRDGVAVESTPPYVEQTDLTMYPLVYSDTENKLIVVGCDDFGFLVSESTYRGSSPLGMGCSVVCSNLSVVINGSCSGFGCCQTTIPQRLYNFTLVLESNANHSNVSHVNPSGYAFIGNPSKFNFSVADLGDPNFVNRTRDSVPVVLEWFVWDYYDFSHDISCEIAKRDLSYYACHHQSRCHDVDSGSGGYRCTCLPGYKGNPYLSPGCTDIDECANLSSSPCSDICINTPGSYYCTCPKGYHGNGRKDGTSCIRDSVPDYSKKNIVIGLAATLGSLLLPPIGWWLYIVIKKRETIKQKARNFKKNGGLLLQHRMLSDERIVERTYFFTVDELEKATDHFNESRILGRGGQGTVYKGMLGEGRLVAVKKSKTLNESQRAHFINEVVIMSQIIHRNIVRLLGCCLESEVPLLVYEFVPNGTLFNHLHHLNEEFPITWRMRLQIASDLAGALAYLHSFSYYPILHRDIKSSNILLDDKYRAKLSDFGLSKSVAPDQTHVTTRVMGTFGYLDPEYFQTNHYTEKSDVYSFGVVLVELLTGQKAIRAICEQDRSLVSWFLSHTENSQFLDIVDPDLVKESSKEEVYTIVDLATRCLNPKGHRRPTMKEVLLILETEESPQTDEVETSSQFEQVLAAGTTNNSSYHENVATSSTSSMDTRYCQSSELSLLFNPR